MMNIYSGNVVTDKSGDAAVTLPDWFESENGDFRYQLTVIGQFAQAIVGKKIANHEFTIKTNTQQVEVSWQVTAGRHDTYALANPLVVDQQKPAVERGFYIHPEVFYQPEEKQTEWAWHPEQMKRMKEQRQGTSREKTPAVRPALGPAASAVGRNSSSAPFPAFQSSSHKH